MAVPAFDPRHLDIAAFAAAHARLSGEWPLASLHRLCPHGAEHALVEVNWAARGERREASAGQAETWLHLRASATLELVCQRCLQNMPQALKVMRSFRFVNDEAEAERLDEHCEDDVLALGHPLDLQALVEDELILALPLIARHELCPQPLLQPEAAGLVRQPRDNAFAVLESLRRRLPDGDHDA